MILDFGKFKGQDIENIDEEHILWLAKPNYNSTFYKNLHDTKLSWKVPFGVKVEARKILAARGWVLKGEHYRKKA